MVVHGDIADNDKARPRLGCKFLDPLRPLTRAQDQQPAFEAFFADQDIEQNAAECQIDKSQP